MNNNEEIKLIDIQLVATLLYFVSLSISFLITYNDKLNLEKKDKILSDKLNYFLSVFNRSFVVIISLMFLYINYKNKKLATNKNEEIWPFNLQIVASEMSLLAAIIVLYVVLCSQDNNYTIISGVENPNL